MNIKFWAWNAQVYSSRVWLPTTYVKVATFGWGHRVSYSPTSFGIWSVTVSKEWLGSSLELTVKVLMKGFISSANLSLKVRQLKNNNLNLPFIDTWKILQCSNRAQITITIMCTKQFSATNRSRRNYRAGAVRFPRLHSHCNWSESRLENGESVKMHSKCVVP